MNTLMGMTDAEMRLLVDKYIGVTADGFLKGFTRPLHETFYAQYCNLLEIDVSAKRKEYGSTAKTFRGILKEVTRGDQARIIRGVLKLFAERDLRSLSSDDASSREELASQLENIASRLEGNVVPSPPLTDTLHTVQRALRNAQVLIQDGDPASAVDRIHTAFHGHLIYICRSAQLNPPDDATVPQLWKQIINYHPNFQIPDPRADDIKKMLRSSSAVIDAFSPVRNRASLSHPNEDLLEQPEAWLVLNMTHTLLDYLNRKLA